MVTKFRTLFLLISFALFAQITLAQITRWRAGEMEIIATYTTKQQRDSIGMLFPNGDIYSTHAYLYLTPDELQILKSTGISYKINIPDLNAWSSGFGKALVPPGYYTFNQIKNIADSLATHYPDICKKVVFGYTAQFKELAALKISDNVNVDENEAEIMFDGGIHGNEVGGSQNVIQFARDLCLAYNNDPYITGLVDNREIWLYYCVNPYGRDYMIRENGSGVDINRDFGYFWGGEGGSAGPFSQPESRALRDCQTSNQFVVYTNYHSGDEVISYPWSYRYSPAPDNLHINHLASIYSIESGYQNLPYGQGSQIMYLIQGSTKDFNYGSQGSVAWSIEISVDKQPAGPNIQHYYNINKPAMLAMIEHAGYGLEGTITDAITGMPVKAAVWVGANYPAFTDGEAGDYHKYVVPGTYTLKFTANGYQTQTVENVLVNSLSSTVTNVQLQPVSSQFAFKTGFCRIPGFSAQNPGDEGYTAACLGEPDQVNYSLGKGGYIMVDMQNPVVNESGNDIEVVEGDTSPEGYSMYALVTPDSYWNYIGSGTGTSQFDLETAQLDSARYFVVWDDNNGTANVDNAGFDFDALRNLHPAIPDTLASVNGYVYDSFSGLIIPEAQIQIGDSVVFTDSTGYYNDSQLRGNQLICASMPNYITECDTLLLLAGQTTHHDFFLLSNVGILPVDKSEGMIVCPNPIRSEFEIRFRLEKPQPVVIQLYSLNGLLINELNTGFYQAGNHVLKINTKSGTTEIAPGCYLLSLELPDKKITTKVIKLP